MDDEQIEKRKQNVKENWEPQKKTTSKINYGSSNPIYRPFNIFKNKQTKT